MTTRRDRPRRVLRHPGFASLLAAASLFPALFGFASANADAPSRLAPRALERHSGPRGPAGRADVVESARQATSDALSETLRLPSGRTITPAQRAALERSAESGPSALWLLRLRTPQRPESAALLDRLAAEVQWIGPKGWILVRLPEGRPPPATGLAEVLPMPSSWKAPAELPDGESLYVLRAVRGEVHGLEARVRNEGLRVESRLPDLDRLTVRTDAATMRRLLDAPELLQSWPLPTPTTSSVVTVCYDPMESRDLVGRDRMPVSGSGVVLGIRDDGLQVLHEDLSSALHEGSRGGNPYQHGTMVTAITAGRLRWLQGGWTTRPVMGMAPEATIFFRHFFGDPVVDLTNFATAGARVSNHSYSYGGDAYNSITEDFDRFVDDNDHLVVTAVGNNTLHPSNVALGKNVLAVGAVQYLRSPFGEIGQRASYSNTGPTADDGRLKPDLVAPGGAGHDRYAVVSADDDWDGVAIGPEWESDDRYTRDFGTSFATPHVTGALAAALELQDLSVEALVAKTINTAIPLRDNDGPSLGGYATTELGYGLVDGFSLSAKYVGEIQEPLFVQSWLHEDDVPRRQTWNLNVLPGTRRLSVTLAYTDEEGVDTGPEDVLRDDLDLKLISPSGSILWARDHLAAGVIAQSPIEKLTLEDPEAGAWRAEVHYTDSPAFGNSLLYGEQRYAVHALAEMREIDLTLKLGPPDTAVAAGDSFFVPVRVTNEGGGRAVGVHVSVENGELYGLASDCTRPVGNLFYKGESRTVSLPLVAPSEPGSYPLVVSASGASRIFSDSTEYPRQGALSIEVIPAEQATPVTPGGAVAILRAAPNPSSGAMTVTFGRPGAIEPATVEIFDLQGRRVRLLHRGPVEGTRVLQWDGTDEHGELVASGVYFLRRASDRETITRKVVVLR